MKTRTKVVFGAVALVMIGQHQLGRYLFEQECQTNEGAWAKPLEPANSIAYDALGVNSDIDRKGCGWPACTGSLISYENRRAFVEVLVHQPSVEFLSTEPGWYRYWLARRGDPACATFYASTKAQADWHTHLSDPRANKSRIDPNTICIASKKIEAPESRYLFKTRAGVDKRALGINIWRHDLIDRHTGEVRTHFQRSLYLGPWLYEVLDWLAGRIADGDLAIESCQLLPERYERPQGAYEPKSMLRSLSSEDWAMLPATPNFRK